MMSEHIEAAFPECDNCEKQPAVNIQKLWVRWKYDAEKDEYSPEHEILDVPVLNGENLHLCDDCMALWGEGKI